MGRRRKRKNHIGWLAFIGALVGLALILQAAQQQPGVLVLILVGIALFFALPFYLNKRASDAVGRKLAEAMEQHITVLARRRTQLLTHDAYGTAESEKWWNEVDRFLNTQVVVHLSDRERRQAAKLWPELKNAVEVRAARELAINPGVFSLPIEKMSPTDFEMYCAQRLRNAGWSAQTTRATGDQGIDVIAEFRGAKTVFQCKLYSQPVGNKAVQEAVAGRAHYGAQFGAVVTNATFTPSAKQLAASNSILLLHFSELDSLAGRLRLVGAYADSSD